MRLYHGSDCEIRSPDIAFYECNDQFCFASQHAIDEFLIFEETRKVDL